jgi:hypothetical protein
MDKDFLFASFGHPDPALWLPDICIPDFAEPEVGPRFLRPGGGVRGV